ncbi:hypothetical protein, partial [Acinetobacter bereziniae]|uniref:hypothetical protein n=1 Tax=Acinetobacter bereziniae TaxID=106648 RepID=UPI001C07787A
FSLSYLVIHKLSTILQTSSGDNFKKKNHDLNFSRKVGNKKPPFLKWRSFVITSVFQQGI